MSKRPIGDQDNSTESPPAIKDFAQKWRQVRACARCHRLKMKCAYEDPTFTSCKRCFAAGVECSPDYDPTSKYKVARPRKKHKIVNIPDFKHLSAYINKLQASSNVVNADCNATNNDTGSGTAGKNNDAGEKLKASLVEEISGLRNVRLQLINFMSQIDNLVSQKQILMKHAEGTPLGSNTPGNHGADRTHQESSQPVSPTLASGVTTPQLPPSIITPQNLPIIPFEKNLVQEIIKLQYLTVDVITEKFEFFKNNLLIYWPIIQLPDSCSVEYLIRNKPLLLLTCIVTSCVTSNDLLLYNILSYYLDINLSHRIFVKGTLNIDIIQCYLILSIWNPQPKKWGTFKHQLHLLTSLNLSLVVDLSSKCEQLLLDKDDDKPLRFADDELIRLFLMVYASCGSLGLSLPKFKLVSWTSSHHLACNYLHNKISASGSNNGIPADQDRTDIFIYYLSRLICIGQEIAVQLENLTAGKLEKHNDPQVISDFIATYEDKLLKLMLDYRLTDPNMQSYENSLVGLTYQQILITIYDHLIYKNLSSSLIFFVSSSLNKRIVSKHTNNAYKSYKLSVQVLKKLIVVCKRLIDNFLFTADKSLHIPTFFNYRPMNSLISLIKAKILIKLLIFELIYEDAKGSVLSNTANDGSALGEIINDELISDTSNMDFNLKSFFNHFHKKYEGYANRSTVFEKMFTIVKKMKKLIKLVDTILNRKNPKNQGITVMSNYDNDANIIPVNKNNNINNKNNNNGHTAANEDVQTPSNETIAGFTFHTDENTANSTTAAHAHPGNDTNRQEINLTVTSNLANNDLLNLLYELGKEKAVENIEMFELNEEIRKRRKLVNKRAQSEQQRLQKNSPARKAVEADVENLRNGKLPVSSEDFGVGKMSAASSTNHKQQHLQQLQQQQQQKQKNQQQQQSFNSSTFPIDADSQVNYLFREIFSHNVFDDMINDELNFDTEALPVNASAMTSKASAADLQINDDSLLTTTLLVNEDPTASLSANLTANARGIYSGSASNNNSQSIGNNNNNALLYNKGHNINQFLVSPSEDLFSYEYLFRHPQAGGASGTDNLAAQDLASSHSFASTASVVDDYNNQLWTNQNNNENNNGDGGNSEDDGTGIGFGISGRTGFEGI